ncbi:DNA replication and repair protein RecF [Patescibacteria group bacterium]|nr:DNA replication and repair protein RecF [Patescibacteria group bacterium]
MAMILRSLSLQNFRSYKKTAFEFSPQTTLIVGKNTSGKTNLLEAVHLLATGKSFRAEQESEMIRWGEEISHVSAEVSPARLPALQKDDSTLKVMLTTGNVNGQKTPIKKYLVNGIPRRQIDFIGNFRAVLFWPEDLELVTDSPSLRRRYLDSVLVQVDREYRRNLYSYERGLRQRNRLLDLIGEGKAHRHQLTFWDQLLIKAGGYITNKRQEYIDFVNADKNDKGYNNNKITYDKSVISEARLLQYKDEEIAAGATLVGPHRDDFVVQVKSEEGVNYLDLSKYGSRGEQRLAVLWLKLAELDFIESKTEERPVLLLDDIFSELDEEHRELVLKTMDKQQTIVTATDEGWIPKAIYKQIQVIRL